MMADKAGEPGMEEPMETRESPGQAGEMPQLSSELENVLQEGRGSGDGDCNCYCGKGRSIGTVELQCSMCQRWYHADCTSCYIGTAMPFMCNYVYSCKSCSPTGLETFNKKQASFPHICYTAVANLTHQSRCQDDDRIFFSKDKEIIPFIDKHWENLCTMPRRVKLTWHTTVHKTLTKEVELFVYKEEGAFGDLHFGLHNQDLSKVGPSIESLIKTGSASTVQAGQKPVLPDSKSTRGTKRKTNLDGFQPANIKHKKSDLIQTAKLAPHGYPVEHPFNKDGYRYILAEPDPHAPNRQAFDESVEWAGKPIPGYLYRTFLGSQALLALHDRAPQLKISDDRLSVTGEKGYSMVRATHGVRRGSWYFEVKIVEMPDTTATRIGWSQALGNLQAPCGYDKFSYSWRSRKGTRFHQSRGKHYSAGYKEKDILGFHIYLPEPEDPNLLLQETYKDRPLVKFKNHLYYEEKDYVSETERSLKESPSSTITFFKNGESQGVAFTDLFEGIYYPTISLYKNCKVTCNFGPNFKRPPKKLQGYRPMSEAASQTMVEYALADILYHVENEGKLPEF